MEAGKTMTADNEKKTVPDFSYQKSEEHLVLDAKKC